jgi:hypothetical protein
MAPPGGAAFSEVNEWEVAAAAAAAEHFLLALVAVLVAAVEEEQGSMVETRQLVPVNACCNLNVIHDKNPTQRIRKYQ